MLIHKLYRAVWPIRNHGLNNSIIIHSKIKHSIISVNGNNNKILIGENCIINNCKIIIYGDNNNVVIEDTARLLGGAKLILDGNGIVHIGKNAGIREVKFLAKGAEIKVGELCMFSNNILIRTHDSHNVIDNNTKGVLNPPQNVILGDHVWVGQNVTVLKGVTIGSNSILALGAIVTKSCPANCIMAGVPAKIVKSGVSWDY